MLTKVNISSMFLDSGFRRNDDNILNLSTAHFRFKLTLLNKSVSFEGVTDRIRGNLESMSRGLNASGFAMCDDRGFFVLDRENDAVV